MSSVDFTAWYSMYKDILQLIMLFWLNIYFDTNIRSAISILKREQNSEIARLKINILQVHALLFVQNTKIFTGAPSI